MTNRLTLALYFIAGVLCFWAMGFATVSGADLWWHLAAGRWLLEHLHMPEGDPWSYTASDRRWVIDAWLSDVVLYGWSRLFGQDALVWWKWSTIVLTFSLLMTHLWRRFGSLPAAFIAALLAAAIAEPFLDIRPQLHSLLCFVILISLTLRDSRRTPWAVIPLMVIWSNLHAGFALGFLTLPILLLPDLLREETRLRTILLGLSCAVAVLILNPNGYHAFTQPVIFALDSDSSFRILNEWLPPFKYGGMRSPWYPYGIGIFALAVVAWIYRAAKYGERKDWPMLLVAGLTLAMSLQSRRFITIFAISQSLVLASVLAPVFRANALRGIETGIGIAGIFLGIGLLAPYPLAAKPAFHYLTGSAKFPVEMLRFIEKNKLEGNLFALYQWGGYVSLVTNGRMKVYIDGRASAVYPEAIFLDYLQVGRGQPGWTDIVERSGADFFLWPAKKYRQLAELQMTGGWRLIYRDSLSSLYAHRDFVFEQAIQATEDSPEKQLINCKNHITRRQYELAEACLRDVLTQVPYHFDAHALLIKALSLQCKDQEAHSALADLRDVYPKAQRVMADMLADAQARCDTAKSSR